MPAGRPKLAFPRKTKTLYLDERVVKHLEENCINPSNWVNDVLLATIPSSTLEATKLRLAHVKEKREAFELQEKQLELQIQSHMMEEATLEKQKLDAIEKQEQLVQRHEELLARRGLK